MCLPPRKFSSFLQPINDYLALKMCIQHSLQLWEGVYWTNWTFYCHSGQSQIFSQYTKKNLKCSLACR